MLSIIEPQIRLMLLHHLAASLSDEDLDRIRLRGEACASLARLRELTAGELARIAAMRAVRIEIDVDAVRLADALRVVAMLGEKRAMEEYFIRHGATWQLMTKLFKVKRHDTLRRRRIVGSARLRGRTVLPDRLVREQICQCWRNSQETDPRASFLQLHLRFPSVSMSALEAVLRSVGAWP